MEIIMGNDKLAIISCLVICCVMDLNAAYGKEVLHPDTGLHIDTFLKKYKYPLEIYKVQTRDGYILTMHRIPRKNGKPVLLMHGLFGSSMDWLMNGPNNSLGLILADQGHDVWLGNQRGNFYSRKHVSLDPVKDGIDFWDFSFHEIGLNDLSAKIDFILKRTGQSKLHYVGFSQGCTSFFALTASKPLYNNKIQSMSALSPVAIIEKATSPLLILGAHYSSYVKLVLNLINVHEIFPRSRQLTEASNTMCINGAHTQELCAAVYYVLSGYTPLELNQTMLTVYTSNLPSGTSRRQILHFLQLYMTGGFKEYDYGFINNLITYSQQLPPEYDASQIVAPIYLFYGDEDIYNPVKNVEGFAAKLANVRKRVKINGFTHLDTIWGIHAPERIFFAIDNIIRNS